MQAIPPSNTPDILQRAYQHKGASFVEIYQNCIVYNDAAFEQFASKKAAPDALLWLEHGKPMLFANGTRGLRLNRERLALEVVQVADGNIDGLDILVRHGQLTRARKRTVCVEADRTAAVRRTAFSDRVFISAGASWSRAGARTAPDCTILDRAFTHDSRGAEAHPPQVLGRACHDIVDSPARPWHGAAVRYFEIANAIKRIADSVAQWNCPCRRRPI